MLLLSVVFYDSWVIANNPDTQNNAINGVIIGIMFIIFIKMTLTFIVEPPFRTSFILLVDCTIIVSLIFDLTWVSDRFTLNEEPYTLGVSRVIKLAARYGRFIRLFALIQIISNYAIYLFIRESKNNNNAYINNNNNNSELLDHDIDHHNSTSLVHKVSAELSEQLSLRVAMIIMALAIITPYMRYNVHDYSVPVWLNNIQYEASTNITNAYTNTTVSSNNTSNNIQLTNIINNMYTFYLDRDIQLLSAYVTGPYLTDPLILTYNSRRSVIRNSNKIVYTNTYTTPTIGSGTGGLHPSNTIYNIHIIMDETYPTILQSIFFLILVLFVLILMFTFIRSFQYLLETNVIQPLHKLITSLKSSAQVFFMYVLIYMYIY